MDCYRLLGDDSLAEAHANEVLRSSINPDGTDPDPMRTAEARVTLGLVAARSGDLEGAVDLGRKAISGAGKSLPSLSMHVRELGSVLADRYPRDATVKQYLGELHEVTAIAP